MSRGTILGITADEAVDRAVSLLGKSFAPVGEGDCKPLDYKLGRGGKDPSNEHPGHWSADRQRWTCDCMGFVAWCLGFDRYQRTSFEKNGNGKTIYGGWINTDSMLLASRVAEPTWFATTTQPAPGDVVVYGARWRGGRRIRIGHTGLVVSVPPTQVWDWNDLGVIHCSSSAARKTGSAITETDGESWRRRGRVLRFLRAHQA